MSEAAQVVTGSLTHQKNSLSEASSAYLRSAMHQPVDWMEWGDDAFAKAVAEDKPILLDIGAVWCHWCHVMDRESYEDHETAHIINDLFVPVKVDRDERPDVDTRYQAAVAAISGQGGWPLTAFLTPDGKPFFGGTYFPPQDRHGRPSLRRVLLTMAEAFQTRRSEVEESASSAIAAIEHNEAFSERVPDPGSELVEKLVDAALKQFDPRNGGFGAQPKFPHSSALDLLIDFCSRAHPTPGLEDRARTAVLVTLDKMSKGGIYDQLAGGFHRYSVDERWVVPHFEKMAYDNSELLKNYVHAYQTFVEPECARVARDIMRWMNEWLTDRDLGGFYASQDADFSLDDDGDYFTWSLDEAREVLTEDECRIASAFYDIGEIGDMHHNAAKNVLYVREPLSVVAKSTGFAPETAAALLGSARSKMYAARRQRPTPFVDKTIYVGWNGMCISSYLLAGRVLNAPEATAFALKTLDRVLETAWSPETGMCHVVAYGETSNRRRIPGVLEDYCFVGQAALDAWETTGELRYFTVADAIMQQALHRFYDTEGEAFFDTEAPRPGERRLGALTTRRKPLQDSPTPAGNSVAAALLIRLEALTGDPVYGERAQLTLENFAGVVEHLGLYSATYGLALQSGVQQPVQVCIIADEEDEAGARRLEAVALARFAVNKSVIRLRRDQLNALPPSLAQTLPHLPPMQGSFAIVCSGNVCHAPVNGVQELLQQLNGAL